MSLATERSPLAVFAVGNEARGDDGVAHVLLRRLAAALPAGARVSRDFQLQIEDALELRGAELVLFIDAATGLDEPFAFYEIAPAAQASAFSHALSPVAVLDVFERIEGRPPPPAFVLAIRAGRFELGDALSDAARADCEAAGSLATELLSAPGAGPWRLIAERLRGARVTGADDPERTATRNRRG